MYTYIALWISLWITYFIYVMLFSTEIFVYSIHEKKLVWTQIMLYTGWLIDYSYYYTVLDVLYRNISCSMDDLETSIE